MNALLVEVSNWLLTTRLSAASAGDVGWLWPLCEILHFMGMALLFGCIGTLDLRLLGLGKGLPVKPLNALVPFGILGFLINLVTGFIFFAGRPDQYVGNIAFEVKMLFIVLAGLNVMAFYVLGINRKVDGLRPGEDAYWPAKVVAALSLFLWVGVMYWGRMLPFIGDAF